MCHVTNFMAPDASWNMPLEGNVVTVKNSPFLKICNKMCSMLRDCVMCVRMCACVYVCVLCVVECE